MNIPGGEIAPSRSNQATAHWADPAVLEQVGYEPGETWFGYTLTEHPSPFGYSDDRHIVTIAGNRAGKGTCAIIPNLCEHPGSLICIDPKGENATITASGRGKGSDYAEGLGQQVWVLDPFKVAHVDESLRGRFNPLDCIDPESPEAVDDASAIAESLIVATDSRDAHWDESARVFLQGLILFVVVSEPPERRHLPRVRELLTLGDREAAAEVNEEGTTVDPFFLLLARMEQCEAYSGVIAAAAATLTGSGENERGSVLSTARRNTSFIDSPGMREVLSNSSFVLDDLKGAREGLSLYLCLPARRLDTHGRWLRTVVMLALGHMERLGNRPATGHPALFLLDEFATLRHVSSLSKAAGYIAGFGVKLWVILQDLNQLKANYKETWETFLGNAGVSQFFGNSDTTTLEYISNRLGQTELRQETTGSSTSQNESKSTSYSDSQSVSQGQSQSSSSGHNSSNSSSGVNASYGETFGTTEGSTYGTVSSVSRNESIAVAPLMRPDEIAKAFARGTGRQVLFVTGAPPIVLGQSIYFHDPYFLGKYDPHPDHTETVPPTLEEVKARRLEIEQAEEERRKDFADAVVQGIQRQAMWKGIRRLAIGVVVVVAGVSFAIWKLQPWSIPVENVGFKVTRVKLEKANPGYLLRVSYLLHNQSKTQLNTAQVGWQGRFCTKRLTNGNWSDCTPFRLPKTTVTQTIHPNIRVVFTESFGPIRGLRGMVFVDGKVNKASR